MKLLDFLKQTCRNPWYWSLLIAGSLLLLATALFYQYGFDELPCLVCIQVRLLVSLLVIVSIVGLLSRHIKAMNLVLHLSVVLIWAAMAERSYLLLGTERGFIFADCGFDLGLPSWFAIEQWLPWLYRVETTCGYTPEIIFGITMAEALIVLSGLLLIISLSVFIAYIISYKTKE